MRPPAIMNSPSSSSSSVAAVNQPSVISDDGSCHQATTTSIVAKLPLVEREVNGSNTSPGLHHHAHHNSHHNHHHSHHHHLHGHSTNHHHHHHHGHNNQTTTLITAPNSSNGSETSDAVLAKYLVKGAFAEHYDVEDDLGKGRYAVVRRCRCRQTGGQYAAKVLRKARLHLSREAIVQEVFIHHRACRLHPRIAKLLQVFEAPRDLILVIEYAAGGELWHALTQRDGCGLQEPIVRRVLVQLLDLLAHLHANGIIHCDINPHNILLARPFYDHPDYQPDIRLCDFGLARSITAGQELRDIRGTLEYVAPEVLLFDPIGSWSDMWSVGVLAYVLLSGFSPFAGMTKEETLLNISRASVVPTSDDDDDATSFGGLFPPLMSEDDEDEVEAQRDDTDNDSNGGGRAGSESSSSSNNNWATAGVRDFISRLLVRNPRARLSASECLRLPWLQHDMAAALAVGNISSSEKGANDNSYCCCCDADNIDKNNTDASTGQQQQPEKLLPSSTSTTTPTVQLQLQPQVA